MFYCGWCVWSLISLWEQTCIGDIGVNAYVGDIGAYAYVGDTSVNTDAGAYAGIDKQSIRETWFCVSFLMANNLLMTGLGLLKVKGKKKKDDLCVYMMMVNDKYGHISYHSFDLFRFFRI